MPSHLRRRRAPRRRPTSAIAIAALAAAVAAGCADTDPSEGEAQPDTTTEDVAAPDGDDGRGERPPEDLERAEEQREEFAGSSLEATGTIGSTTDRVEELESRYDATETGQDETQLTVPDEVLFDFDSDVLRPEAAGVLDEIAEILQARETQSVEVVGHTDDIGTAAYNQDLSERRADAVVRYLVDEAGIDPDRLQARGAGQEEPVAPNAREDGSDDPEGRAANRRVEIVLR